MSKQLEAYNEIVEWVEPDFPEPPTSRDIIEAYNKEHPEEVEVESPEEEYIPEKKFHCSVQEIADEMGDTVSRVKNTLQSSKRKMRRRLLISSLMDRMSDDEIGDVLCDKGAVEIFLRQEYG